VAFSRLMVVFCVLTSRSGSRSGTRLWSVGGSTHARLRWRAVRWLTAHGIRFDQIRIDVVGLLSDSAGGFTVEHVRGAV
jgi:Holliday junction resolvase-like predicted endonuclease